MPKRNVEESTTFPLGDFRESKRNTSHQLIMSRDHMDTIDQLNTVGVARICIVAEVRVSLNCIYSMYICCVHTFTFIPVCGGYVQSY